LETTILFWTMITGACAYAIMLGGWEGRWTAGIFVTASALSYSVNRWFHLHWHKTNISMFLVDFLTLLAFYIIAAKSRHWWPVWVVAFQLNTVASHLATMISPDFSIAVYKGYGGLWAIPCALVMVYGIWRDRTGGQRLEYA
jgi:hypothetical protein